jgi:4-carboxymuconolactone decarboxylase
VFRLLAHADDGMRRFLRFTFGLWDDAALPARERELAILQVAHVAGSEYEWAQHFRIALDAGVTPAETEAIRSGALDAYSAGDRALLQIVADVVTGARTGDATFDLARERFGARMLMELHLLAGAYLTLARVLTNFDVEIDTAESGPR